MGFASGSMSYQQFAVVGDHAGSPDQAMLDKLAEFRLQESDLGVPEELEVGWCGGRHVYDGQFAFEHNVYNDALLFGLRVDTNRVPGDVRQAYAMMEEQAAADGNPSGFATKSQKREAKDVVGRKVDEELRSGRYRRSKMTAILWDVPGRTLFGPSSAAAQEKLMDLFERTFDLELVPITAGSLALRTLEPRGRRRDFEDLRPTRFVYGPEGEGQVPDYPWTSGNPERKDFLGNEFLLWLWHAAEEKGGTVATGAGEVAVLLERSLDLDCAFGQTGRDSLRGDGPTKMPEARDALRSGKLPRKVGLLLNANGMDYSLSLNAETLTVGSLRLPEVEDADNPRVVFEERITMLRDFAGMTDALFDAFLTARCGGGWEGVMKSMRKWILETSRKAVAA